MEKKVSIIVPTYNVEQYLKKCVDSLINQTYKNIEIFLVDDGSTDNSGKLCDELAKKDSRIKVVHKENGGYGSVLEYSISHISSDYFLICDPDDWLELDAVKVLTQAMIDNDVDLVVARKKKVYSDGTIKSDKDSFKMLSENYVYNNLINFLGITPSPHSKLYKTNLCKEIKFPQKINYTDYLLYHVYLTKINSAIFIDKELSNYFFDRPGNSANADKAFSNKALNAHFIVTNAVLEQIDRNSKLYKYSVIAAFLGVCHYLALLKKYHIKNEEYFQMNFDLIDKLKINQNDLIYYLKANSNSKIEYIVKKIIYTNILKEKYRNFYIFIFSFLVS